ncbi:hypothetical protein TNIN_3311 [Trichonephila inaurata madagascariensis]|uniref:Uncharacterized protein n=1 Tax=Trichonephila inaurata madagascariensis TaxID=2747483 RepID=A0A8X6YX09_9ARAC|nr:hypothetical protein TNIN_3311 [Trichonephila inaurata madagascariensis]
MFLRVVCKEDGRTITKCASLKNGEGLCKWSANTGCSLYAASSRGSANSELFPMCLWNNADRRSQKEIALARSFTKGRGAFGADRCVAINRRRKILCKCCFPTV